MRRRERCADHEFTFVGRQRVVLAGAAQWDQAVHAAIDEVFDKRGQPINVHGALGVERCDQGGEDAVDREIGALGNGMLHGSVAPWAVGRSFETSSPSILQAVGHADE